MSPRLALLSFVGAAAAAAPTERTRAAASRAVSSGASRRRVMATSAATSSRSDSVSVGLCQILVGSDKQANLARAEAAVRDAATKGADLVVLPECFNSPYDTACFPVYAEPIPDLGRPVSDPAASPSVACLVSLAKSTGATLIGGSIPERALDGRIYNTSVTVHGGDGQIIAKHRKVHLFDIDVPGGIRFKESDTLTGGSAVSSFAYTHPKSGAQLQVGVGICYDLRFPELSMLLARERACDLLVFPGAFNMTTGPAHWELLLRARALDNQLYVAACSPARAGGEGYQAWGHSTVVDPWGEVTATTGHHEAVIMATIDTDKIAAVRTAIPVAAQRRSDVYNPPASRKPLGD